MDPGSLTMVLTNLDASPLAILVSHSSLKLSGDDGDESRPTKRCSASSEIFTRVEEDMVLVFASCTDTRMTN
jgi:hypothetical protein